MTSVLKNIFQLAPVAAVLAVSLPAVAFGSQGAQRMLYAVPNSTFVQNPSGDSALTINDTSGSIATLQTAINNARSANPSSVIAIHLLSGATYWVNNSSGGLVLGSQECLVASGATIQATNSAVTNSLITISSGATNVSIAGGTFNANGANIYGIFAPSSAARVNIDKVTVLNCGQDCIQLNGNGSGTFDNEMTVTRCDVSGSAGHAAISIWNATQTTCIENYCHSNSVGIWLGNCGYACIANNVCVSNATGINCNSGNNNYVANNTCNDNGTGIYAGGSGNMIVSDLLAGNSVAGIYSGGSGNIFSDNLFSSGNTVNFSSNGSGDDVIAYKGVLSASGQNYFYPPLVDDQHNATIVNGMGRYDLYDNATTSIDAVQSEYNSARSANPNSIIVLHLNGTYTVGSNPLTLSSDTCILLGGTIQINSSTSANQAIYANGASYVSISGGTIDGGTTSSSHAGHNAIYFTGCSMFQIDGMTLQNFGTKNTRVGGSDVVRIDHGSTPRVFTRNTIVNGSARGFWLATGGVRDIVSDNTVSYVQMDGIDCDASTFASLVKFNYSHDNSRCGVFIEQSASYNLMIGNVCNYNGHNLDFYNNSSTPRGAVAYNSLVCNACLGGNLLQCGATGPVGSVESSDNFIFNNTFISGTVKSDYAGVNNYYSQNYMSGVTLTTSSGVQTFFNSPDVSGNVRVQDSASSLFALVPNAATTNNAPVAIGLTNSTGDDQWQLIPTDSGYFKIVNQNSSLAMNVSGASTNTGAPVIQWPFGSGQNDQWMPMSAGNSLYTFVNRLSGLNLDVPTTTAGTQLDQQSFTGAANQQFNLIDTAAPVPILSASNTISWTSGGAPDGDWTTAANWGGNLPQAGEWLGFGSGSQILTTNDFPAGTIFGNITFTNGSPSFTLNGNGIILANATVSTGGNVNGGGVIQASISNQTINLPITLAAGAHVIGTGGGAGALAISNSFSRNTGATAQFSVAGGAITSSLGISNGIIGGWAAYSPSSSLINNSGGAGAVDWATTNSSSALAAYSGYTTVSGSGQTIASNAGSNVKVTSNGSTSDKVNSGTTTINTLIWSSTTQNGFIDIPASSTLRLGAQGAILHNDNKYLRIGNGQSGSAVTAGGADNTPGELCVYNLSYYAADAVEFWTTFANNGSGAMTLTTFGSVKIDNANTYSGGTYINVGDFWCNGGGNTPFGTGSVYVFPGGRADIGGDNDATLTNNFFIAGQGFLGSSPGAIKGTYNGRLTGLITLLGDAQIDPNAGAWTNTCTFSGGFAGTGSLTIGGPSNVVAGVATFGGNCAHSGDTIIDATANANGGSGIFISSGTNNVMNNGGNLVLLGGSTSGRATFDLNGTTQTINGLVATNAYTTNALVQSSGSGGTLIVGNSANSIFGGVLQNGGGTLALTKTGGGTLALAGNNTYTGNTVISNGVLALSGSGSISNSINVTVAAGATLDASGRSDQTFTLNSGQMLQGGGTVNASLISGVNSIIQPGDSANPGTLTVGGAAHLQGTTVMKLSAAAGTCDQLIAGNFIFGGTLTVTNLSGTFTAGQSFPLFSADAYSGSFSAINFPALDSGLAWSTNNLAGSGTLQVVKLQPQITTVVSSGTNLTFSGTGGTTGNNYYVLTSTNLALPPANWTVLATNTFDINGNFAVTNAESGPQQFFLIQVP